MVRTRSLIYGVGVNDADYLVAPIVDGKQKLCPFYKTWKEMIRRCVSAKEKGRNKSCSKSSVCDEWLFFSSFKSWMEAQDWSGKQLDKDILVPGNHEYSPDKCIFVSGSINTLLNKQFGSNGLPLGVNFSKERGKYCAYISINGSTKPLGRYDDPETAGKVYMFARVKKIIGVAMKQTDLRLRSALMLHVDMDRSGVLI